MSLDGIVIRSLVHELQSLIGGRIGKIHQPNENDLLFHIRAQGSNQKLLISANPTFPRIHLSEHQFSNPQEAPMFCMLLRKHLESGIIEEIHQVSMERIIHIDVRSRDELGDVSTKRLIVEIMGRHSNIILIDPRSGTIIDGIHHVTPAISSHRVIMPGQPYSVPPEQYKLNAFEVNPSLLSEWKPEGANQADVSAEPAGQDETAVQKIVNTFSGISPLVAKEVVHRAGYGAKSKWSEIEQNQAAAEFARLIEQMRKFQYLPQIRDEANGKSYFSVIELTHLPDEARYFSSVSACLEAYFGDKAERDTVRQRVADLHKLIDNEKNKNIKKIEKLKEDRVEAEDADRYRIYGELLTASLHELSKGDASIDVLNYYDPEMNKMTIPLDPQLSPSENAQRYFKKYSKYKNSLPVIEEQLQRTHEEIIYLQNVLHQLGHAALMDIEEIREELAEQGYIRRRRKLKSGNKKKKKDVPLLSCYTSAEGIAIYVGKNNKQNEYLTTRLAHSSDTWLHTKDIPGSHVVIRNGTFSEETLLAAAQLAAYFSQARSSSQVPVDYTLIRHVHKPNGAKPGYVTYDHQKTLYITPDEDTIKQLPFKIQA